MPLLVATESQVLLIDDSRGTMRPAEGLGDARPTCLAADPRVLLPQEASNERVKAALALYVRRIVREIGSLAAALGGLDMLVFTAGIGENNPVVRERVGAGLRFLGVSIDPASNAAAESVISDPASCVLVAVEPTNEEWIVARDCIGLLAAS